MPSIHVIYDPHDRVSAPNQDWFKHSKSAGVVLRLPLGFEEDEGVDIEKVISDTMRLLMTQIKR